MTTAKDLLSLPSLSHMKLIGGAAGLSRTVTWPYVILCPPIGEWVSGGEFLFITVPMLLLKRWSLLS